MSPDGENWTNVTGEGTSLSDLVMISGTPVSLDNASLPSEANNLDKLHLRWLVTSDVSTSGGGVGDSGSSQLVSITVKGDTEIPEPEIDDTVDVDPKPKEVINETVAEWVLDGSIIGDDPVNATGGRSKQAATFQTVGGPFYDAGSSSHVGWDNGVGTKYWLATLSTKNYENLTLSSEQRSSNSGPRDFKVEISSDKENWISVTDNSTDIKDLVVAPGSSYNAFLKDAPLPKGANNQEELYIRWVVTSTTAANPVSYPDGAGGWGSNYIRNMIIKGDLMEGAEIPTDTEAPTAPTNLLGVAASDTAINLSWTASSDNMAVAGYNIFRDGTKVGTATTTSYNDTGLTAGKEYDYYVIAFDSSGNQSNASATIKVKTKAEPVGEKSTIAAWGFVDNGEHGTIMATDGAYKAASTFKAIGGPFFEYISTGDNTLSYWGWDGADYGSKYWLATVPTTGFKNITLSSEHNSSGSGPRDFKVQISSDGKAWNDIPNGNLTMVTSSYNCPNDTCKTKDALIPSDADNQDVLYIRWVLRSGTSTSGSPTIGGSGSSRIKNLVVSGERMQDVELAVPTIDTLQLPVGGSENVAEDAPVSVKFNKSINLVNAGVGITIKDEADKALERLTFEVDDNILTIEHPLFRFGKVYTVSIPKEAIKGIDDVPLARDISWNFTVQDSPFVPKLINMSFIDDPKTSIGFAWYTDKMTIRW